jgi:hypothetical protein
MSECAASRPIFAPYCTGKLGLDLGYGGDAFLKEPTCLTMDLVGGSYTNVGADKQILRGHCADLSGFCDNSLSYIHNAHLAEDFFFPELRDKIIPEWRRVLEVGGLLCTNCPDQTKYLAINEAAGTMDKINLAHKEPSFSLAAWNSEVISHTGPWEVVMEQDNFGDYSWLQILRKI